MTEPRWIPLSERKPDFYNYSYCIFCDSEDTCCSEYIPEGATHWLKLEIPPLPKEEKPNETLGEFLGAIHHYVNYWDNQKGYTSKEKLERLAHSMLCMLDGVSDSFDGDINKIFEDCGHLMLHDHLY